ncbi:hypothetical protein AB0D46_31045 [Streptomyces sp. NPDC048383]|uniref:hypothetical protein n=1 Tax=Streptomyces sp. NPDC048383 TaxID=3155386 RepID=UPI0034180957
MNERSGSSGQAVGHIVEEVEIHHGDATEWARNPGPRPFVLPAAPRPVELKTSVPAALFRTPEYPNLPTLLEKIATKTGKGNFYRLTSHGLNGAFHLDVLCTNAEGAERSRERLVLRKSEPSEGALVCKPLIGFMVGDECRQVGSDPGLQLTEGGTECLKVVVAGQQCQELQDVAAVVSGDLQEVDNCHGGASDKVSTGEAFQSAVDSPVGTVIVLGVERGDQGFNRCGSFGAVDHVRQLDVAVETGLGLRPVLGGLTVRDEAASEQQFSLPCVEVTDRHECSPLWLTAGSTAAGLTKDTTERSPHGLLVGAR